MNPSQKPTETRCIRCGKATEPPSGGRPAADEETLCSQCYEKMMFPETRLKNMEIFD